MDRIIAETVRPKIQIIIEGKGESWSAYVPSIPGCIAAADSPEEVRELLEDALTTHLAEMRADALREAAQGAPSSTTGA